jgi:hypothetical protein
MHNSDADKKPQEMLTGAIRILRGVYRRLDDEAERVAQVEAVLADIIDKSLPMLGPETAALLAQVSLTSVQEHVLEQEARSGALSLAIDWGDGAPGRVHARINGGRPFTLQRKLGMLLSVIASGAGTRDGLVGWRSYEEVAAELAKRTGRPVSRRNVTAMIHKLRQALRAARQNWLLVRTDHSGNVRFALRVGV